MSDKIKVVIDSHPEALNVMVIPTELYGIAR
jgi:hypothetical protein